MDPYVILGVPRGCTRDEVSKAFRTLVHYAHPDHGGEDRSFLEIRAAYEQILEDLDRRNRPIDGVPDVVPRDHSAQESPDPRVARSTYIAWLDQSAKKAARRHDRLPWRILNAIGVLGLLGMVVCSIAAVPAVIYYERLWEAEARRIAKYGPSPTSPSASIPGPSSPPREQDPRPVARPSSPHRVWVSFQGPPKALFVVPYDSIMFLTPLGGDAGGDTEFGLGESVADHGPIFTGLPNHPSHVHELRIGRFREGSKPCFYLKTNGAWAFMKPGTNREAIETFADRDNSLGGGGTVVEKTGPDTWVLHLDDVGSNDDDDDDVLIQIRLEPVAPTAPGVPGRTG
jgi:DnaJ domain